MLTDNLTIMSNVDHDAIVETIQAIGGASAYHFTNGIYARQELPIRETLLAGFQYMMDRKDVDPANPPALLVAVNSDKSVRDFNMTNGAKFPTYEQRVEFLAAPLRLLNPSAEVVFFPYDEETPTEIYAKIMNTELQYADIHKHGDFGRSVGSAKIPGFEHFDGAVCFPFLNGQKALYEDKTERATSAVDAIADLYSENNEMGRAYLSADAKNPRILFPISMELRVLLGQPMPSVYFSPASPNPPAP